MTQLTLLCFDYGTKRIGVAVGQTLTSTATPLETVAVIRNRPDWNRIEDLIKQWQPDALVVGDPLNMRDERQALTDAADKFARQLAGRFNLTIHRAEERLSSREAANRYSGKDKRDDIAAQIILEGWLAEQQKQQLVE